ncbi:phenylacetate-CoA oxygenase subunit PaaJ [Mesobacillus boroniphilus]|uniref:Phenylacetate-CoA oxygenase subunit PaaJ n=1 Tax=Mesobacillus boroniphilus TaxID=308892 RepID=A0A944CJH1_9BACI|nr:1,2-phenylacetyl-CoA epoxidase subunit PaaD [Mesobacillus boroniphilus]MBS8263582.1 phenylacetate-CoA oxygenase subunit PaaJ [Mesobacillus boroniphilus]
MLRDKIIEALQTVKDPEIDSVSIIELGMLDELEIHPDGVLIKLLPTFMGCPALDIIKNNVVKAVSSIDEVEKVDVKFIFHPPWTSDRVTELGREKLKEFGIAPPPRHIAETGEWQADCPYCGSTYTTMENLFGPTACRSILYCKACKNPFEAMKPVSTLM